MDLLPNVDEIEEPEVETSEVVEKEEPKVNLKVSPFIETPKKRKKKVKKIVEEIVEENDDISQEVSAAEPEQKIHQDAEAKMKAQIRECIMEEMKEAKEVKEIKKPKTKRALTDKQKEHMATMRALAAKKRGEKQRIKVLEEKLTLNDEAKKEDINIYVDNYLKEKEKATPKKVVVQPSPKPSLTPHKVETKVYDPFNYDSCF